MKQTLLFPILLLSSLCSGQMLYENTFYDGAASRVVLENSGEKYYLVDQQENAIKFYNADYSLWKTIPLVVPVGTLSISVNEVSELKINPDANIEISCSFYTYATEVQHVSQIVNELGTILLSVPDCMRLFVDEQVGLPVKILSATGTVYSVPDLLPEHDYNEGRVKRVALENSGEKYYALDAPNDIVNVYHADHSFWKSIALATLGGINVSSISIFAENEINSDNLIEVGYTAGNYSKIINENGDVLLTVDNCFGFRMSKIEGRPDKIFADKAIEGQWPQLYETEIFSNPGLNSEHIYEGRIIRVTLEN